MEQLTQPITKAMGFTKETMNQVYTWGLSLQMNITPGFNEAKQPILTIPTLNGEMVCEIGDWVIQLPFPKDWQKLISLTDEEFQKVNHLYE